MASVFFWRGVGVICVHSVAGGFIFYCQRIPPERELWPWQITGGGAGFFIVGAGGVIRAGRCEFFRRGIFFFFSV